MSMIVHGVKQGLLVSWEMREREAGHTETMIHKCKHHVDIAVITNNKRDESGTCKLWQVPPRGKKKPTSLAAAMPATEAGKRKGGG